MFDFFILNFYFLPPKVFLFHKKKTESDSVFTLTEYVNNYCVKMVWYDHIMKLLGVEKGLCAHSILENSTNLQYVVALGTVKGILASR